MTPAEFIKKWKPVTLKERSFYVSHFNDLCKLVGHPTPVESDKTGASFTFERGAAKRKGGKGWADVWKKDCFAFEYKGKDRDLEAAFAQLEQYREDLENPPLLVAADAAKLIIKTNFNKTVTKRYEITLDDLNDPAKFERLRQLFHDPDKLKPTETTDAATSGVANIVGSAADLIRSRGYPDSEIARFLDRIVFCMFAEDVGLLPENIFTKLLARHKNETEGFDAKLKRLFEAMADGGDYGEHTIPHFNGNLFDGTPVVPLKSNEIAIILDAARKQWGDIDPAIFGTLFERALDKKKRAQLGAHYTSREDIQTLVEPVIMTPLRREWTSALEEFNANDTDPAPVEKFLKRLQTVTVLDPACGSGNFLYVSLQKLLDLELEAINRLIDAGHPARSPAVGPWQLRGIEKDPIPFQLAQMSSWIGYLQWLRRHGFDHRHEPILRALTGFENKDAILACDADGTPLDPPQEPTWPEAEFIVGNPPFLGGKKLRKELGDLYVDRMFALWSDRVRAEADLCCYWFERARAQIETNRVKRAGLLATQGIRGGASRDSLKRLKRTGDIFFAESDRPWILDGANVHVSMIGFDDGSESEKVLNSDSVLTINANLSRDADITQARRLVENVDTGFMGDTKGGAFDIHHETAVSMLYEPNPHGRPNSDVLRPWINALDVTRRNREMWIIDFGVAMPLDSASLYEAPFNLISTLQKAKRESSRSVIMKYWVHERPRPEMREKLECCNRCLVTARVAKHRLFGWINSEVLPDCQVIAFARSDDYFFGVLHSRLHEVWARAQGTQLRERESGFRYTPTTCFETFPFPEPTPAQHAAIGEMAKRLNALRENWLNPPEWVKTRVMEFPASVEGPWRRFVVEPDDRGIGTARWPRVVPRNADAVKLLKKRTLTNLYNERPTWLINAHQTLDAAVFDAYGWDPSLSDDAILASLLELNLSRPALGHSPAPPDDNAEPEL